MIANFIDISDKTKTWNSSLGVLEIQLDSSYTWVRNHYLFLLTTTDLAPTGIQNSTAFYFYDFTIDYKLRLIPIRKMDDSQRSSTNYNYLFTIPNNDRETVGQITYVYSNGLRIKFLDNTIPFNDYATYFNFVKLYSPKLSQPIILRGQSFYSSIYEINYMYINNGQSSPTNLGLALNDVVRLEGIDYYSLSHLRLPNYKNNDTIHKLRNNIFTNTHQFHIGNTTAYFDAWENEYNVFNANATYYENIELTITGKPAGSYTYNLRLDYSLIFISLLASTTSATNLAPISFEYSLDNGTTWGALATYYQPYNPLYYTFYVYPVPSFAINNNTNLSNVRLRLLISLPVSTYAGSAYVYPTYWIYALRTGKMTAVNNLVK